MKSKITILALGFALSAHAQSFQNLNFEQANPMPIIGSPLYPYLVTAASAFPHWTVSSSSSSPTPYVYIFYDDESSGSPAIDLLGTGSGAIDGKYSVLLQSGLSYDSSDNPDLPTSVSLSQTGTIPANTQSMEFIGSPPMYPYAPDLQVTFAGNSLSPIVLSSFTAPSGQAFDNYGVDVSSYAGQTGQLQFTIPFGGFAEIDDIKFSQIVVTPEPNPIFLTGIGGLIFALHRRFRR